MDVRSHAATTRDDASTVDGVVLYDEGDLHPVGDPPDPMRGMTLVSSLFGAAGAGARESLVRAEMGAIGVDWLDYGDVQWSDDGLEPVSFLRSYSPRGWAAGYCDDRMWEVDDRPGRTAQTGVPRLWTAADADRSPGPSSNRRDRRSMRERLASHGIGSGMTIALPMPASCSGSVVHLLSRDPALDWASKEVLAGALLLVACLHAFIRRHTAPLAGSEAGGGLSVVQTRIAYCIARGNSDKEVARSLLMNPHAVDYHLRALRRKFNVRNRVQLAQAIGRAGITARI